MYYGLKQLTSIVKYLHAEIILIFNFILITVLPLFIFIFSYFQVSNYRNYIIFLLFYGEYNI